jgi:hypothetical protein
MDVLDVEALVSYFRFEEVTYRLVEVKPHGKIPIIKVKGRLAHPLVAIAYECFHLSFITNLLNMFFK